MYTVHSGSHLYAHFQPVPTTALRLKASGELFTAVDTERGGSLCSCLGTALPVRWCLALLAGIWPTLPPRSFKVLKALATRPATCLRIGWFPCGTWAQWWEKRSCHLLPSFFKYYRNYIISLLGTPAVVHIDLWVQFKGPAPPCIFCLYPIKPAPLFWKLWFYKEKLFINGNCTPFT